MLLVVTLPVVVVAFNNYKERVLLLDAVKLLDVAFNKPLLLFALIAVTFVNELLELLAFKFVLG